MPNTFFDFVNIAPVDKFLHVQIIRFIALLTPNDEDVAARRRNQAVRPPLFDIYWSQQWSRRTISSRHQAGGIFKLCQAGQNAGRGSSVS